MFKFFKDTSERDLANTLDEFAKEHTITSMQYSTCKYDEKWNKVYHCVMVTYN
jgi:hypothetical protein